MGEGGRVIMIRKIKVDVVDGGDRKSMKINIDRRSHEL